MQPENDGRVNRVVLGRSSRHAREGGYGHYDDEASVASSNPLVAVFKVETGVCEVAKEFWLAGKLHALLMCERRLRQQRESRCRG